MIRELVFIGTGSVLFTVFNILYFIENYNYTYHVKGYYEAPKGEISSQNVSRKYLIDTINCQIPDIDPFNEDMMRFVHKEEYTHCSKLELLTYIDKSFGLVTLNINRSLLSQYSSFAVTCCYSEIYRVEGNDDQIWFTPCRTFRESVAIYHPFVKVVCRNSFFMTVYENVHASTLLDDTRSSNKLKKESFSVLLVGIESMSKQNLIRTMPKSYEYLEKHFINLKGYNKIGDDTYPNLMAILTGRNVKQLKRSCPFDDNKISRNKSYLSKCGFIWKKFRDSGYVTAFAEDASHLGTLNFAKRGFFDPPTDYYYRPYVLAAEKLSSTKSKCHNRFCSGPENSGERILNAAKDFSITFKDRLNFGLFWTNSFSHDNINCPSAMDDKVLEFLSDAKFVNSLESTIFVFYSDHGFRFGDSQLTNPSWLEERLPFIYLRVPSKFKERYPTGYNNLVTNSRKLTSPYDLYNTLKLILRFHDDKHGDAKSLGCPTCRALFTEMPEDRTCEEAGVSQHLCTCTSYRRLRKTHPLVQKVASFVIEEINNLVNKFSESSKCVEYSLDNVHSAGVSEIRFNKDNEEVVYISITITTKPKAVFEATIETYAEFPHSYKPVGGISRTDRYEYTSFCVRNADLKKYCYCDGLFTSLRGRICVGLNIC